MDDLDKFLDKQMEDKEFRDEWNKLIKCPNVITGDFAKKILKECKISQSEKSKKNGKILMNYFNKFTK